MENGVTRKEEGRNAERIETGRHRYREYREL